MCYEIFLPKLLTQYEAGYMLSHSYVRAVYTYLYTHSVQEWNEPNGRMNVEKKKKLSASLKFLLFSFLFLALSCLLSDCCCFSVS